MKGDHQKELRLSVVSGVNVRDEKLISWLTSNLLPMSEWSGYAILLTKMQDGPGLKPFSVWPILNGVLSSGNTR